jgi:hypothetical protein
MSNRTEISKLLKVVSDENLVVKIFDSMEDLDSEGAKYKEGKIFKISQREGTFSIRALNDDFSTYEKRKNLFLKVEDKGLVFVCFGENFGEKFGSFNLPSEIMLRENRKYFRKPLSGKLSMNVRANGHDLNLKILDISQGGACLLIQEDLDVFLKNFRTFEIQAVKGVSKFPLMFAKIAHSRVQKGTSILKTLKVGVEFEDVLDNELVEEFI